MKAPYATIAVAVMLLAPAYPVGAQPNGRPVTATQATMQQLFRDLCVVFSLSLDELAYQDPENRTQILTALYALAGNAERMESRDEELGTSYDRLQRALVRDANEAVMRFRQGQYEGSRFLITQLMNNCFACHTREPSERSFEPGDQFLHETAVETFVPEDRVRLEVTARQFEAALRTYEEMFASRAVSAARIASSGAMETYLKICVRVEADCDRAVAAFEAFRQRPDVPAYLDVRLARWAADLKALDRGRQAGEHDPLGEGRRLIRDAQYSSDFPSDPQATVRFVAASGYLYRYLRTRPSDRERLSEAYYLLGVAESHVSQSYWVAETDYLLEMSIRTAPRSVYARMAYNFLEEYTVSGYTGSSGVNIPPDVQSRLDELRALVEGGD